MFMFCGAYPLIIIRLFDTLCPLLQCFTIEKLGRRPLMIGGFAAMGICSAGITLTLILQVCLCVCVCTHHTTAHFNPQFLRYEHFVTAPHPPHPDEHGTFMSVQHAQGFNIQHR